MAKPKKKSKPVVAVKKSKPRTAATPTRIINGRPKWTPEQAAAARAKIPSRKGTHNKITVAMKDAIMTAMELAGRKEKDEKGQYNQEGDGGLQGYMLHLALNNEDLFCRAFASRILPLTLNGNIGAKAVLTEQEVQALCVQYGIPFDMADMAEILPSRQMIDVTPVDSSNPSSESES
jgi:hypothetical protein